MKPHRQIRHSKRVSSETGVAIQTVDKPQPTRYQQKLDAIRQILQTCPPAERSRMIGDIVREEAERG